MKRIIGVFLTLLLIVGAAYAATKLSFSLSSVTNSSPSSFGAMYETYNCQVVDRTGISEIVLELQGRMDLTKSITNDLTWYPMINSTIVNATAAASDNSDWSFQSKNFGAEQIRIKVLSGADATNTVTGTCKPGGN